jgi:hypothetical protein
MRTRAMGRTRAAIVMAGIATTSLLGAVPAIIFPPHAVAAAAQSGYPTDCEDYQSNNGWYAKCASGGGKFKATVICKPWDGGPQVHREAPDWSYPGGSSWVSCPPRSAVDVNSSGGGILFSS